MPAEKLFLAAATQGAGTCAANAGSLICYAQELANAGMLMITVAIPKSKRLNMRLK